MTLHVTGTDHPTRQRPGTWANHAACKGRTRTMYPGRHDGAHHTDAEAYAIAICNNCPVTSDCLAHALANDEPAGVWGGKTTKERRRIRRHRLEVCNVCRATFTTTNPSRRLCSEECKKEAHRVANRRLKQAQRDQGVA